MKVADYIKILADNKKMSKIIVTVGIAGMIFIMISSFLPDKDEKENNGKNLKTETSVNAYINETERRLEDFLESTEGVGDVKVMITLDSTELYIYATEEKTSISEDKRQEEESYVMSGREKNPVLETVENPRIKGAVVACEGASSPSVRETVYNTVERVLGIPSGNIYVTKLN